MNWLSCFLFVLAICLPQSVAAESSRNIGKIAEASVPLADNAQVEEDSFWRKTRKWNSVTGYKAYLKIYPKGLYVEDAKEKIRKIEVGSETHAWTAAKKTNTINSLERFKRRYPKSTHMPEANARIARLKKPALEIGDLNQAMWVKGGGLVNLRATPDLTGAIIGTARGGRKLKVTGKARDKNWYRIALKKGVSGFVYGTLLSTQKPAPTPKAAPRKASAEATKTPNLPIPGSFLTSPDVINTAASHPAFADAPPVGLRRLKVAYNFPNDPANHADDTRRYNWLRRGLVRERRYYRSPGSNGGIFVSEYDNVAYLNGLLSIASKSNSIWKGGGYTSRAQTTTITDIDGKLFPLALGNRVTFAFLTTSYEKGSSNSTWRHGYELKVARRLLASEIDPRLSGVAWEIDMTYEFGKHGDEPDVAQHQWFFIELFGVFLRFKMVDDENPKLHWAIKIDSFSLR